MPTPNLNALCQEWLERNRSKLEGLGVAVANVGGGTHYNFTPCAGDAGRQAGLYLADLCSGLQAEHQLKPRAPLGGSSLMVDRVRVTTNNFADSEMGCRYAGTFIKRADLWVGLGSGPMRRLNPDEPFFKNHPELLQAEDCAVGVIETGAEITKEAFAIVAELTGLPLDRISLATASAKSVAGCIQVACRVVETLGHMAQHAGFDITRILSAEGGTVVAPPAASTEEAMVRMNEAIAATGSVSATVKDDGITDADLQALGPRLSFSLLFPGRSFRDLHAACGGRIQNMFGDHPLAFSPGHVSLVRAHDSAQRIEFGDAQEAGLAAVWSPA